MSSKLDEARTAGKPKQERDEIMASKKLRNRKAADSAAVINVDMGAKCSKCGAAGATDSGLCLKCVGEKIAGGELPIGGPGVDKPSYPDVDEAAEQFGDLHQRRKDLKAGEDEAKEKLVEAMVAHSLSFYEYENRRHVAKIVTVKASKVKVAVKELGEKEHE